MPCSSVAGLLVVLERLGLDLGSHHDEGRLVGRGLEEVRQDPVGLGRLAVLGHERRLEPGELGAPRVLGAGRSQPALVLRASCLAPPASRSRAARRSGFPCPWLAARRSGRSPCHTRRAARRSAPAGPGRSRSTPGPAAIAFSNSAAAFLRLFGRPPRLVDLAAQEMERRGQLARGGSRGDLLEQRADDRLGLFGIAGLENGPRRPELVLRSRLPSRRAFCRNWRPEVLLAREHQGDSVPRLGLGDIGQLGGGELQMIERARAQLRRRFLTGIGRLLRRPRVRVPSRTGRARSSRRTGGPSPWNSRLGAIRARPGRAARPCRTASGRRPGPGPSRRRRCAGPSPRGSSSGAKPGAT